MRLYRVTATSEVLVVAESAEAAARWVSDNVTEWSADGAGEVVAVEVAQPMNSMPWYADGCPDGKERRTCLDWLKAEEKARKERGR